MITIGFIITFLFAFEELMMKIILIKWLICKILARSNLDSNLSEADDIDLIHKWRPIYNSFVEVQINLPSLDTIQ